MSDKTSESNIHQSNQSTTLSQQLARKCVEMMREHPQLRNVLQSGSDAEQRNILTAWYIGNVSGTGSGSGVTSKSEKDFENFIQLAMPEVSRQKVA